NASPIIRRAVQRSPSAVPSDSIAAHKRINLIRMGTTAISVTWQLGERATVNLAQFLIVLVRTTPVDNPLASVKASGRHHILIERGEPIDNLSARPRLRQTITRMPIQATSGNPHRQLPANGKTAAKASTVKKPTSSSVVA